MPPTRRAFPSWLLLPALAAAVFLLRWRSFTDVPEWDIGTYSVVAQELLNGQSLYTDTWDMKPPAVFYTYAVVQSAFGASLLSVYLLSAITATGTLVVVWLIGRESSRAAAGWAAVIFASVCLEPFSAANMPNTESFINLFMAIAWLLLLRTGAGRRGWMLVTMAGATAAWATMYKHVAIAPAGLLAVAHFVVPPDGISRRRAMGHAALFLGMILAGWLALAGWFIASGRGEVFWQTVFVYPRYYAGGLAENLLASCSADAWRRAPIVVLWPILLLCLLGWIAGAVSRQPAGIVPTRAPRFGVMLAAMLLGSHVAVALPGQFAAHYYQLWYPAIAVAAGTAVEVITASTRRAGRIGCLAAAATVAAVVAPQWPWYQLQGEQWSARRYGKLFMDARADMLSAAEQLSPADDLYIWGDEPWLYFIAQKRARYAGIWKMHCLDGPMAERLTQTTLGQLRRRPPGMVVFWNDPAPVDHPIVRWALEHYEPLPGTPPFPMRFYTRRDTPQAP